MLSYNKKLQKKKMPYKHDVRHKQIGSRKRAQSRYSMIVHRITNTHLKKNRCYIGIELRVNQEDFIEWYRSKDFKGASVDRIDKNGHYELSNMQVIPLVENISKDKVKAKDGMCKCYKCHNIKPLVDFVKESRRINGYSTICKKCECARTTLSQIRRKNNSTSA
jgi:hypothetical protein